MKKVLTLVSVFAIALTTFAQDGGTCKPVVFGIKASPTISWLKAKSNDLEGTSNSIGFSYGLMADFKIGENYAFSTGLDVSHKGGELKYTDIEKQFQKPILLDYKSKQVDSAYTKVVNYKVQHLEIPLTIKMRTSEIGYLTYYAQAGVAPSITIGSTAKEISYKNEAGVEVYKDAEADYMTGVNSFGLAMIIGAGIEYSISGSTKIMAGLTFNNGFTDILNQNKNEYKDYNEIARANFIALNIGIFF